jgi:hypothetical protein
MLVNRAFLGLTSVLLVTAGCAQTPIPTAPEAPSSEPAQAAEETYSVQQVGPRIRPGVRPVGPGSFGVRRPGWWGQYNWRYGTPRPRFFGVRPFIRDRYILVGGYYYPYYEEFDYAYPIYSMPYVLVANQYLPVYTLAAPIYGPQYFPLRRARFFSHRGGRHLGVYGGYGRGFGRRL